MVAVASPPRPLDAPSGDGTSVLQDALTAAGATGHRTVEIRGDWTISSPVVISSNTTLVARQATVTLAAASNCNMLINEAYDDGLGNRDTNIHLVGGTWDRGANDGTGSNVANSIMFLGVDGVTVSDVTVTSTSGKYAIHLYDCTNFDVARITLDVASDGVHVTGPAANGHISDIYGSTGDDGVALICGNYDGYLDNVAGFGDIYDVVVERVYADVSGFAGVKLGSGTYNSAALTLGRITVRNVAVTSSVEAVYIGGDTQSDYTQNGNFESISCSDITNLGTGHGVVIGNGGTGSMKDVSFSRMSAPDNSGKSAFLISGFATLEGMTVRDSKFAHTQASTPFYLGASLTIQDLTIDGCVFDFSTATFPVVVTSSTTSVGTVRFSKCRLNYPSGIAGMIQAITASSTLGSVHYEDCVVGRTAWMIGDFGISTKVFVHGYRVITAVSGLANVRSGATLTLADVSGLSGAHSTRIVNAGTVVGVIKSNGSGAPTLAGLVGDLYDRQDGGSGTYRYVCTGAGDDGASTWSGIL